MFDTMIEKSTVIYMIAGMLLAALIAFTTTPAVRVLAYKIGAIDVPRDSRRMHKKPIPRLGGLSIFFGFIFTTFAFCKVSPTLIAIWAGGIIIVACGVIDDVVSINPLLKLVVQIAVAFVAVSQGVVIKYITFLGHTYQFKGWAIPITVLWIVGLTNAINLIDGLDGLSCGVSAICSMTVFVIALLNSDIISASITAILVGACLGFLPYNSNPAKIFMGDTGALFLGYTLSVLSANGMFKAHAVISFVVPLSIFGLPIFDTAFAFIRRILHGKSPFSADRGHIHHRLIDMGFNQKQSVRILYSICGMLGIASILFSFENWWRAGIIIVVGLIIFVLNWILLRNPIARMESGLKLKETDYHQIGSSEVTAKEAFLITGKRLKRMEKNDKEDLFTYIDEVKKEDKQINDNQEQ